MTESVSKHQYNIGDSVLVKMGNGMQVPGVIEDTRGDQFQVKLAEPWADESGRSSDDMWVTPDRLDPSIEEETGGQQALPG